MKISTKLVSTFASTLLARITLGVGISAALGITVVIPQAASAQSAGTPQPLQDFTNPQNERDSFSGDIGGGGFNVFNLMHQAQTRGSLDRDEFISEQKGKLDQATADFRRQQLLRLQQESASPTNTVIIPQPGSPVNSVITPQQTK
ncbi:MAG TPA: hypothetical protein V6D14_26225 [Coleofasciculaceae cyanobacterium]|jgi:hypothetical protein